MLFGLVFECIVNKMRVSVFLGFKKLFFILLFLESWSCFEEWVLVMCWSFDWVEEKSFGIEEVNIDNENISFFLIWNKILVLIWFKWIMLLLEEMCSFVF